MNSTPVPRRARSGALLVLAGALSGALVAPSPASADTRRVVAHGWFTELGAGATGFLGDGASYSRLGPSFELRAGYDLFTWLAVGAHLSASTHEATVPPPPEGEYYQLYTAGGDARLGFALGPVGLFVDGGVAVGMVSSNILQRVGLLDPGERFSLTYRAGGGLEYQLVNRHYAFGLAGQWTQLPQFDSAQIVTGRIYLRYTY